MVCWVLFCRLDHIRFLLQDDINTKIVQCTWIILVYSELVRCFLLSMRPYAGEVFEVNATGF